MSNANNIMQQGRRGSALIITILIISVISTISFMVSALAISEFRKAGILQDSIAAYYSAESGLEQGLLQYRLWHDAELSKEVYAAAATGSTRTSPTEETSVGTPQKITLTPGFSFYDLKMWYKGPGIGEVDSQTGKPSARSQGDRSRLLYRDSVVQVAAVGAKTMQLAWVPITPNTVARPGFDAKYFVEVVATGLRNGQQATERTVIKDSMVGIQPYTITFGLDTVQSVRIKPWDMTAMKYSLALRDAQGQMQFDNQISYIESTGSAGRAKRTLRLGIDRAGGTGLESQDFVLYSGNSSILLQ